MVFEQIYSAKWIEQKGIYAFILGLTYSIIGIASAMLIFPSDPGLPAVAFISLLILPSLNKLLSLEENKIAKDRRIRFLKVWHEHKDIIKVFALMFAGVFISFALFALVWPNVATEAVFRQQARILGSAASPAEFSSMLLNNLKVLIFCLVFSFGYGAGAVFLLTWNASVWGTLFALLAKGAAASSGRNPIIYFLLIIIAVLPHMVLEVGSYFLAEVAGGIVSKAAVRERFMSQRFKMIVKDSFYVFIMSLIVLLLAVIFETHVFDILVAVLGI